MIRRALVLLALLALPLVARADCPGHNSRLVAFAFESVTVSTVSIGGTAATYNPTGGPGAVEALVQVEAQPIRWSVASTPTAAIGHAAIDTNQIRLCDGDIATFRAIRSGGTDAVLRITYYRTR